MKGYTGLALIVAGVSFCLCLSIVAAPPDQDTSQANKLQELLTERRDVLKSRFEWIKVSQQQGHSSFDEYLAAHNQLLMAELELTSEKHQRLGLLQQRIDSLRVLERLAGKKTESGTGSMDEELLATANRIQAEIDYVREELKPD